MPCAAARTGGVNRQGTAGVPADGTWSVHMEIAANLFLSEHTARTTSGTFSRRPVCAIGYRPSSSPTSQEWSSRATTDAHGPHLIGVRGPGAGRLPRREPAFQVSWRRPRTTCGRSNTSSHLQSTESLSIRQGLLQDRSLNHVTLFAQNLAGAAGLSSEYVATKSGPPQRGPRTAVCWI